MLHDLDELTLHVRNPDTRIYVQESVRALRAGALRAALLSLWVAVNFDIIEKLRELAAGGDAQATQHIQNLDAAVQANDLPALQKFEQQILTIAHKTYEFLNPIELDQMVCLQKDRHRCAHPALTLDGRLYEPVAEQVRAHLVNATHALLAHPPVQGRAALARLQADLLAPTFPLQPEQVAAYLGPKYLDHGKGTLVQNIIKVHLKESLAVSPTVALDRVRHVLQAARIRRHDVYRSTMARSWPTSLSHVAEAELSKALPLMAEDPDLWALTPDAERVRLQALMDGLPEPQLASLLPALRIPGLQVRARARLLAVSGDTLIPLVKSTLGREFVPVAIERLERVASYRDGWQMLDVVQAVLEHLNEGDMQRVLVASRQNSQIYGAGNVSVRLRTLFKSTATRWPALQPEWVQLVQEHDRFTLLRSDLQEQGWLPADAEEAD